MFGSAPLSNKILTTLENYEENIKFDIKLKIYSRFLLITAT